MDFTDKADIRRRYRCVYCDVFFLYFCGFFGSRSEWIDRYSNIWWDSSNCYYFYCYFPICLSLVRLNFGVLKTTYVAIPDERDTVNNIPIDMIFDNGSGMDKMSPIIPIEHISSNIGNNVFLSIFFIFFSPPDTFSTDTNAHAIRMVAENVTHKKLHHHPVIT